MSFNVSIVCDLVTVQPSSMCLSRLEIYINRIDMSIVSFRRFVAIQCLHLSGLVCKIQPLFQWTRMKRVIVF